MEYEASTYAISILKGARYAITSEELTFLLSLPAGRWADAGDANAMALDLARKGLVVSDAPDPELEELRRRDEELSSGRWNLYAALYHFMTRWDGVDLRTNFGRDGELPADLPPIAREEIERFVSRYGPPPDAFHFLPAPAAVQQLPLVRRGDGLFAALAERRTTRAFDEAVPMTVEELAVVLYYVWGAHGYVPMLPGLYALRRTSPSGGALHPVEAYPLVANVDGVAPGLYHYNARDHSLELRVELGREEAHGLATRLMSGQSYFGSAHVAVLMTGRFYRSHWKYRRHQKAYAALLMDVGHLSQTLYLVSAALGLGAFVTAAVNGSDADERLGLDGFREGVLAIAGCGKPADGLSPYDAPFQLYVPRETAL